ncbi:T9SS type A sorting domain-containing protein [Psychroserpens algicola]|uniref:T9SS type A sorting domain-containing protein n=1 Tax=Psychroserpens algicola TaxID=1719034 RepID=A0ABT0H685_9FLAO|nr:T9SS type A sorting domain-containing protein [Psychroserpens algicola]MCK8479893.1 T9SS type A sorting domain-containing protein [Psychroserpens algicola]
MRNHVLLFFAILLSFCASAQLTVRQSSYIFVDGAGFTDAAGVAPLFVTDEVNIVEPGSRIYLRNEAQIIQGTGTTGNSGEGELSIYQTGTANNFAYNYWCSPIGNNSNTNGNENARVELIDESTGLTSSSDATFTTAYDGTSSPLVISNRWLYSFVVSDEYSEWILLDETSPIAPGLGFTMKGIGAGGQLYDFRGKPNNGTITNSIAADQFTLIGNPYPSAIDALLLIHDTDNTNVDDDGATTTGALYYWEQQPTDHVTANYIGGYATYTISAGGVESFTPATFFAYDAFGNEVPLPPPGAVGSKVARRYIPVGQGFMVEGRPTTAPGSFVYVKNEHRVFQKESSGNSYFFRNDGSNEDTVSTAEIPAPTYNEHGLNIVPEDFKRFRLNIVFNQEFTRQLLQNFHHTATDGFDYGLEAPASDYSPTDASWTQDDEAYVIQAHHFDIEKRIPVVIKAENQQPIEFSIFDVQNFDVSQPIFIHDIDENIYVDLRTQNYSINLPSGIYDSRFEITFQSETLSTTEITDEDFDVFQNTKDSVLTILNPNGLDIQSVSVFDISGKSVISATHVGNQSNYHYSTKSLSDGVYVASIHTENNQVISKKVIIKN